MSSQFSSTLPAEESAAAEFLKKIFQGGDEMLSFRPDIFHWKYFADHPSWPGQRSYVLKKDSRIVAHGGVWPLCFASSAGSIKAVHLIDWAAERSAPGAGLFLLRKIAAMTDVLVTIGGSEDTRAILTKIGYRQVGEVAVQVKVVRPWLQFRNTPQRNWKATLRFIRNLARGMQPLPAPAADCRIAPIARFDSSLESVLNGPKDDVFTSQRTAQDLNRMLACPAARFSGYVLKRGDRACGYFLLAEVGKQTRIVDLRVDSTEAQDWNSAAAVAARTAAALPGTAEIAAGFSVQRAIEAFSRAGFRARRSIPVYCYDPKKVLGENPKLDVSLLDGDICFISDAQNPFWG